MRIFTEQPLEEFVVNHPDAKTALQEWAGLVRQSKWTCFEDVKKTFNNAKSIDDQRFVFKIKGNVYRLVVIIKFNIKFVYIRFIGTYEAYNEMKETQKPF